MQNQPAGCLILSGAVNYAASSAEVASGLRERRADVEDRVAALIDNDVAAGTLPRETDARSLAAYVTVVWQGLSAAARDGHSRDDLLNVVSRAMNAWPRLNVSRTQRPVPERNESEVLASGTA